MKLSPNQAIAIAKQYVANSAQLSQQLPNQDLDIDLAYRADLKRWIISFFIIPPGGEVYHRMKEAMRDGRLEEFRRLGHEWMRKGGSPAAIDGKGSRAERTDALLRIVVDDEMSDATVLEQDI